MTSSGPPPDPSSGRPSGPAADPAQPGSTPDVPSWDRSPPGPTLDPAHPSPGSPADLPDALYPAARALFGTRLDLAARYADLLVTAGVERGLLGPREAPRVWDRHLLNCAVVGERIPPGASVVDVGSGAGLPGIVLAVSRPDLTVTLLEPLARRAQFLSEVVDDLGLDTVSVVRGRAEDQATRVSGDVVAARALAPLDRLARWCLPLAAPGGQVLALKGVTAREEVQAHRSAVVAAGGGEPRLVSCGEGLVDPPTIVVEIDRRRPPRPVPSGKRTPRRSGGGREVRRRSR